MKFKLRDESGFSLPTIIALGVVASLWMLGTASLVVPTQARLTNERTADLARSSAEAGLDWALDQLNQQSTRTGMVNSSSYPIPTSVMADYNSNTGKSNFSGTVTIANTRPPYAGAPYNSAYTSYLYDSRVDDQSSSSSLYANGTNNNMWRVLTATVTNNVVSRSVRVIIKPVASTTTSTTSSMVNGTPQPIFDFTAFGIGSVGGNGNTTINSYDSRVNPHPTTYDTLASMYPNNTIAQDLAVQGYGDLGTNGNASLVGNGTIGGNLELFGTSNTASGGPNVTVDGAVQAVNDSGSFANSSHDVTTPTTAQQIPPTPSQPANPTPLPGGGSAINLSGKSTMTLTAGNYVVNSISITGNAQLIIDNSAGPVNIWVQGNSATGIQIGGNGVSNTSGVASNLGIWYSGSQNVQVAGNGGFTGTIFAPNAAVTTSGNGAFNGAAVGQTINLNGNGGFHFDRALLAQTQLYWTPLVVKTTSTTINYLQNWQAVSWHEFNPNSPF